MTTEEAPDLFGQKPIEDRITVRWKISEGERAGAVGIVLDAFNAEGGRFFRFYDVGTKETYTVRGYSVDLMMETVVPAGDPPARAPRPAPRLPPFGRPMFAPAHSTKAA